MTSTQIVDLKGKKVGEVELADKVFAIEPSVGAMHSAVIRQNANARAGTASALTRTEVRGGGAKPWRQKGTGRARAGSRRSPLWRHGGVIFGPKPRDYSIDMPKKARAAALRSALSAVRENLVVVSDFGSLTEIKTKVFVGVLNDLGAAGKKVLLVLDYTQDSSKSIELSARNIDRLKVVDQNNLGVKDLLDYEVILTDEKALNALSGRLTAAHAPKAMRPTAKSEVKEKDGPKKPHQPKPAKPKTDPAKKLKKESKSPKEKAEKKEKKAAKAGAEPKKDKAPKAAAKPKTDAKASKKPADKKKK